jgi:hypothetical protein
VCQERGRGEGGHRRECVVGSASNTRARLTHMCVFVQIRFRVHACVARTRVLVCDAASCAGVHARVRVWGRVEQRMEKCDLVFGRGRANSEALFDADADADGIGSPVGACATV